jgi:large subunit ribosomal protein L1
MPNPKVGTVTMDVASVVRSLKAGQVEYRVDKAGIVHVAVGKVSFGAEKLLDNIQAVVASLLRAKPSSAKGQYVLTACLSSTMGPGVRIDPGALRVAAA